MEYFIIIKVKNRPVLKAGVIAVGNKQSKDYMTQVFCYICIKVVLQFRDLTVTFWSQV